MRLACSRSRRICVATRLMSPPSRDTCPLSASPAAGSAGPLASTSPLTPRFMTTGYTCRQRAHDVTHTTRLACCDFICPSPHTLAIPQQMQVSDQHRLYSHRSQLRPKHNLERLEGQGDRCFRQCPHPFLQRVPRAEQPLELHCGGLGGQRRAQRAQRADLHRSLMTRDNVPPPCADNYTLQCVSTPHTLAPCAVAGAFVPAGGDAAPKYMVPLLKRTVPPNRGCSSASLTRNEASNMPARRSRTHCIYNRKWQPTHAFRPSPVVPFSFFPFRT